LPSHKQVNREVDDMRLLSMTFVGIGLVATMIGAEEDSVQRLKMSGQVLQEIMAAPDKGIPGSTFKKANCAVVIPSMKKAGFVFSAKYGRGFASCRKQGGGWTAPAGMRIEGGGFGLQAGGSATDVVLLVMSKRGRDGLLASKFTLGGEASVAAGPVGRDATAQTDATMQADILSWSRSRGVFGGVSLQGGSLRPDDSANQELYAEKVTSKELLTGKAEKPIASDLLTEKLAQYGGMHESK
jgi:lipid-binding SYLF domain-containing protein